MTKMTAAAAIVGIVLPPVVSFLKQAGFPKWANSLIAAIVCAGAGVITAYAMGQFTGYPVVIAIATVLTVAQVEYLGFWQGSGVEDTFNTMTSIVKPSTPSTGT